MLSAIGKFLEDWFLAVVLEILEIELNLFVESADADGAALLFDKEVVFSVSGMGFEDVVKK